MKKTTIIDLIRYHVIKNDMAFRTTAYSIAKEFDMDGDGELAHHIMALLSDANTFVTEEAEDGFSTFFQKLPPNTSMLPLPEDITSDLLGIMNAIQKNIGIHRFLFFGASGTGKTESVKQIARLLGRSVLSVNFARLIDSHLGQTQKNIVALFEEIKRFSQPHKIIFLFDELDAIALNRSFSNDVREMARVTTIFFRELEQLDERVTLFATTNLQSLLDDALIRRFDTTIDFNRYTQKDLREIADALFSQYSSKFKFKSNKNIAKKIFKICPQLPFPGEIENRVKVAIAFSKTDDSSECFRRLYEKFIGKKPDKKELQNAGFTIREIGYLMNVPKSSVARQLKRSVDE